MKKYSHMLIFIAIIQVVFGQTLLWKKEGRGALNGGCVNDLIVDQGYVYCTGYTRPNVNYTQITTVKYNIYNGDSIWWLTWGSGSKYNAFSICSDNSDGIYVCGSNFCDNPYPTPDKYYLVVIKYNKSTGAILWQRSDIYLYNGESEAKGDDMTIATDNQGGVYVASSQSAPGIPGSQNPCLWKFNANNGSTIWARQYVLPGDDDHWCDMVLINGYIYVTGTARLQSPSTDHYCLTAKYDYSGNMKPIMTYYGKDNGVNEKSGSLAYDNQGNIYILIFQQGPSELILKYNQSLNLLNQYIVETPNNYGANGTDIIVDPNSQEPFTTGKYFPTGLAPADIFTASINSALSDTIWTISYSGSDVITSDEQANEMAMTNKCIYVSGYCKNTTIDIATISYNRYTGEQLWAQALDWDQDDKSNCIGVVTINPYIYIVSAGSKSTSTSWATVVYRWTEPDITPPCINY